MEILIDFNNTLHQTSIHIQLLMLFFNCYTVLTVNILVGQEPPAYFENSYDFVDRHDYSIIYYPIISADYTCDIMIQLLSQIK